MNYKDTLSFFSKAIYSFEEDNEFMRLGFKSCFNDITIYQKNLYGTIYNYLSQNMYGTLNYMGRNNFNYFVRKFISEDKLTSPLIFDIVKDFCLFLESNKDMHEDDFIIYLSKLDWFWSESYLDSKKIELPKGIVKMWNNIYSGVSSKDLIVDFNQIEKIGKRVVGDSKQLFLFE